MKQLCLGIICALGFVVSANAQTATVTITVTKPPPPTITAINCSPVSMSIPDTTLANAVLSTCSVTMSDGSAYTGKLKTNSGVFVMSGFNLVTARNLTSGDDTPVGPPPQPNVITVSPGP